MSFRCPHGKWIDEYYECTRCVDERAEATLSEHYAALERDKQTKLLEKQNKLLEEIANKNSPGTNKQQNTNGSNMFCPKCNRIITPPNSTEMSKYAKFWRDNKCYYCDTILIKI